MLNRMLLVAGGGSSFTSEADSVRGTSVRRTTNLTTPHDYYDTGVSGYQNNGVVSFDTEEYDDDGIWVIGSATKLGPMPSLYNGKRAVLYATCIWQDDITTYGELKIFRNQNLLEPVAVVQMATNAFNTGVELTSRPIVLATGDYFELCARSGDSGTALTADEYSITFSIEVRGV